MAIERLTLNHFTSFEDAEFNFSPGLNVLLGENATGKSHAMKIMYAVHKTFQDVEKNFRSTAKKNSKEGKILIEDALLKKLAGVFSPENGNVGRLVRRSRGRGSAEVSLRRSGRWEASFKLSTLGNIPDDGPLRFSFKSTGPAIFLPSREVLSIYEGFAAAYENRELSFDETYYDLVKALSATALRGARADEARDLITPLERALGGRVLLAGNRFYVKSKRGSAGKIEAPLLAEGHRKLGTIAHLIANGSLMKQSVLFWDEPEANLNPTLVTTVIDILVGLAKKGVQVILATHDYLVSQELSLRADYGKLEDVDIRFFMLSHRRPGYPVHVEEADSLSQVEGNPILDEFAAHYDREQKYFLEK